MKTKRILKTLTLKDVIETLIVYNIEHCRFPHNYFLENQEIPNIHGLAIDEQKLILIDKDQSTEDKREVIIHELIHTKYYRGGNLKSSTKQHELVVKAETTLTYLKLYGVKP